MSSTTERSAATEPHVPRVVRHVGLALLTLAVSGAAYLIWVRGEAMIVDLATLAGKVWCF